MQNLFDSANYPDSEPEQLTAGSRWAWTRSEITAVYPTASYTLKYRFSLLESPYTDREITAGKTGDVHTIEEASADTAVYTPGDYIWQAVIVRDSDSEEIPLSDGLVKMTADLGSTPGNTASWVYRVLSAVRATIEGTATQEQASYAIAGRSLARRTPAELLELERDFAKRWAAERAEMRRKSGRPGKPRVLVTMGA